MSTQLCHVTAVNPSGTSSQLAVYLEIVAAPISTPTPTPTPTPQVTVPVLSLPVAAAGAGGSSGNPIVFAANQSPTSIGVLDNHGGTFITACNGTFSATVASLMVSPTVDGTRCAIHGNAGAAQPGQVFYVDVTATNQSGTSTPLRVYFAVQ
jgi:hypothetical protein